MIILLNRLINTYALKGHAQAKIIKKSVILFWLTNMTICYKHVHRLELQKFFNFCAAHLPVRIDIETKFPYFLLLTWLSIIRNREFHLYIKPNWCMRSTTIKFFFTVLVYGHVYIIRSYY